MNEKAELTRTVNEHFEFIINKVSPSSAIFIVDVLRETQNGDSIQQ